MNEQKDMSPFARAMRVKLGLVQPRSESDQNVPEDSSTGKTIAQELFAEIHPDLTDEELNKLMQEF